MALSLLQCRPGHFSTEQLSTGSGDSKKNMGWHKQYWSKVNPCQTSKLAKIGTVTKENMAGEFKKYILQRKGLLLETNKACRSAQRKTPYSATYCRLQIPHSLTTLHVIGRRSPCWLADVDDTTRTGLHYNMGYKHLQWYKSTAHRHINAAHPILT